MSREYEYGDQITLQAMSQLYNVEIIVVSTRNRATTLISPDGGSCLSNNIPLIILGHYPEGAGEHYVALGYNRNMLETIIDRSTQITWETTNDFDNYPPINNMDSHTNGIFSHNNDMDSQADNIDSNTNEMHSRAYDMNSHTEDIDSTTNVNVMDLRSNEMDFRTYDKDSCPNGMDSHTEDINSHTKHIDSNTNVMDSHTYGLTKLRYGLVHL